MEDLKLVNKSGFLLQLRLERLVQETQNEHGWKFLSKEHPWEDKYFDSRGFIDLIIKHRDMNQKIVIECKRVQDTSWIFLVPSKEVKHEHNVKGFLFRSIVNDGKGIEYSEWNNLILSPTSYVSVFCIIPGQDQKGRHLLERTAAELIQATEALAMEEMQLEDTRYDNVRIYYSMIVITAELKVCIFNPEDIDIKSGTLQDTNCSFRTVPYVRFKKSLSHISPSHSKARNIVEIDSDTERTVLIVNSSSMLDLLKSWQLDWPNSILC